MSFRLRVISSSPPPPIVTELFSQQSAHLPAAVVDSPEEEVERAAVHWLRVQPDTPGDEMV